ncbi:hypothetical protein M1D68_15800 [Pseudomonas sp. R4-84]
MTAIKERPILFSAPMVRAILQDRKTVTRRVIKPQPNWDGKWFQWDGHAPNSKDGAVGGNTIEAADLMCWGSPYGKPGDRLWVRETTEADYANGAVLSRYAADGEPVLYAGCGDPEYNGSVAHWNYPRKSRPSIHMQRWTSRILLEITDVRVERLQDITNEQAQAEGCFFTDYGQACFHGGRGIRDATECEYPASKHQQRPGWMWDKTNSHEQCLDSARNAFGNLWQSVGGDWNANPWVWVVEFKRVTP